RLLQYYVLFGLLKTRYKIKQQWQSQTAKEKEGYEQILKFFFEHPEINEATAEHFTQDDPAYRVVANRKDGITEEDIPLSRYEASQHLAATEASLKAQREAVEAIKQALAADNAGEQTWRLLSLHQE